MSWFRKKPRTVTLRLRSGDGVSQTLEVGSEYTVRIHHTDKRRSGDLESEMTMLATATIDVVSIQ